MYTEERNIAATFTGTLSILAWVCVFTPQIYENYRNKGGKSLSITFLWIWLVADIFSIAGALMEGLMFTVITLAVYYTVADTILIGQVYYYRRKEHPETEPLLISEDEVAGPVTEGETVNAISKLYQRRIIETLALVIIGVTSIVVVSSLGFAKYFGWVSALLYIGSRMPQIWKTYRRQTTEGLSLSMFILSILGNVFYCISILLESTDKDYVLKNLPWLLGAAGTLALDITILVQFYVYKEYSRSGLSI